MGTVVTGSPIGPFGDAVLATLRADAALAAIVGTKIAASLPTLTRTDPPYIVLGRRQLLPGSVAMQREGGEGSLWIDFWSDKNGPDEVQRMLARGRVLLLRASLRVAGFVLTDGSLVCAEELVIPDVDPDMPQRSLYHGVQHWTADLEEAV
jgi:hypothetical protein